MSMLAGPRRKQKVINLRAKNSAWSNDTNKFGQRMLEKMGWSEGKGLGANENGIVEHVIAKYKNDDKGLGYEDKNDQWTKHEDDFNSLLANLSNGNDNKGEKLHSGVSLEVKSKKSKARVHYHKFTRGKDLTRYSEKDLANIFGKKSFKEEKGEEEPIKVDIKTTEQIFTEKGSMEDYFKNKLAAFKSKSKITALNYIEKDQDDEGDCAFKGFSMSTTDTTECTENKDIEKFSFYESYHVEKTIDTNQIDTQLDMEVGKKKKKKKKSKEIEIETIACDDAVLLKSNTKIKKRDLSDNVVLTELEETIKVKKKPKKSKYVHDHIDNYMTETNTFENSLQTNGNPENVETNKHVVDNSYVPKKKKKRKNKDK